MFITPTRASDMLLPVRYSRLCRSRLLSLPPGHWSPFSCDRNICLCSWSHFFAHGKTRQKDYRVFYFRSNIRNQRCS